MKSICPRLSSLFVGLALILGLSVFSVRSFAVDPSSPIIGNWEGTLDPSPQPKKKVVVRIAASQDGTLSGTIDYPDENASGIAINAINFKGTALHFESTGIPGFFDGTLSADKTQISGTWVRQGATGLSLVLTHTP